MKLNIVTYPDPVLRRKSLPVSSFGDELHAFLDDMYETMVESKGVGLAAIQVGVPSSVMIINPLRDDNLQSKDDLLEIVNPEIISMSGEIFWHEGCLSLPGFYDDVRRFSSVEIKYQDRFGDSKRMCAHDFLSVAIQHEFDHINGILFVDRLSFLKRKKFEKELRKYEKKRRP